MTNFLLSNTFWKIKTIPQTTEIQRKPLPLYSTTFCNIPAEIPYHSIPCIWQRTFHKRAEKRRYNTYMQNSEIQRSAFVPTFCVFVKTKVVPIKL